MYICIGLVPRLANTIFSIPALSSRIQRSRIIMTTNFIPSYLFLIYIFINVPSYLKCTQMVITVHIIKTQLLSNRKRHRKIRITC